MNDLKFAFRQLLKNRGFTAVAVLTLALGIGANTAIFSFINAILVRPLPYQEPDRIVQLWSRNLPKGYKRFGVSLPNLMDLKGQSQSFDYLAYYRPADFHLTGSDRPEEVASARVSADFFNVLGTPPVLGRTFRLEEDAPGAGKCVVISHSLWQRRYGGNPNIVGQSIGVEGQPHLVCGVMTPGFSFPEKCELWLPYAASTEQLTQKRNDHVDRVIGRIKSGVTPEAVEAELSAIGSRLAVQYPESNTDVSVYAQPLRDSIFGSITPALLLLFAAVGAVLLIACANVANLQLARGLARQKDLAVQAALGAGRWRIMRQLLTESIVLSCVSAAMGLLLAQGLLQWFAALAPANIPRIHETRLDATVLAFTCVVAVLTGIIFGLLPAWEASKLNLSEKLMEEGRSASGSRLQCRTRSLLVVGEIAAAVVLLVGSGLFLRSFHKLENVALGFDSKDTVTMRIRLPWWKYHAEGKDKQFFQQLRERLLIHPGFEKVGMACVMPTADRGVNVVIKQLGDNPKPGEEWSAGYNYASPGFFEAMGISLLDGRDLSDRDTTRAPLVVVINEPLTRRYFPGQNPLGRQLFVEGQGDKPFTVVGVVGGTRGLDLTIPPKPQIYFSYQQINVGSMWVVVRGASRLPHVASIVSDEVRSMDPDQSVGSAQSISEQLYQSTQLPRFRTFLLTLLAGLALVLSLIGVYSLIAYTAVLRRKEMGVRMALGATGRDILKLVLGQGGRLAVIGVVVGVAISFVAMRFVSAMLYEVEPVDGITFAVVSLSLLLVATIACWIPARRASQVDPILALRAD